MHERVNIVLIACCNVNLTSYAKKSLKTKNVTFIWLSAVTALRGNEIQGSCITDHRLETAVYYIDDVWDTLFTEAVI
jgi:hypothetical protein